LGATAVVGVVLGLAGTAAFADPSGEASAILDGLASDAKHKAATAAIVQRGKDALERATRMRAAGDEAHAKLADGLALELAETGRDLVRAIDVETTADETRRAATDAGVMGERERALLEEGIARNGRLKAEIAELDRTRASGKHDGESARSAARSKPAALDAGAR
jgi:hypothetical protein